MDWKAELSLATEAAVQAGKLLLNASKASLEVHSAEGRDIKLQADRDSETVILEILKPSRFPVLAEESGESGELASEEPFWVVDPLDGTLNYSRRLPLFCVSVALLAEGKLKVGVVFDFVHNECFRGIVKEGAWLGEEAIQVSDVASPDQAVLATGFPSQRDFQESSLLAFVKRIQSFKKTRLLGSAALSLAYVACGRVDAYFEEDIMLWDVAAGAALVEAAGGFVEIQESPAGKWMRRVRCSSRASIWEEPMA